MKGRAQMILIVAAGAAVALAFANYVALPKYWEYRSFKDRKDWKERKLPQIAARAKDTTWIANELALAEKQRYWMTNEMLVMANGEWLVYRFHCSKRPPYHVRDIFLARGSNGKWYYSTFHFCVDMIALSMCQEEPPPDLAMFVKEYNLYEFDGKSDLCLGETASSPASWNQNNGSDQ